jgi:hypothetical protein
MSDAPPLLRALQAWMHGAITQPRGLMASAEEVEALVLPSARQTARERLAIYHQAYFARLLEVLREVFPVLLIALERETFDALALAYLEQHPPTAYSLNRLADQFVDFLRATRPPREDANAPDWADFMIDVARLETTIEEVFDGPGSEGAAPLDASALAALSSEDVGAQRLQLAPSVRLLASDFPLHDYYTAARRAESPPLPAPSPSWQVIYRRDFVVRRLPLTAPAFALLSALAQQQSLSLALEAALALSSPADLAPQLPAWFQQWSAEGLFCDGSHLTP